VGVCICGCFGNMWVCVFLGLLVISGCSGNMCLCECVGVLVLFGCVYVWVFW